MNIALQQQLKRAFSDIEVLKALCAELAVELKAAHERITQLQQQRGPGRPRKQHAD